MVKAFGRVVKVEFSKLLIRNKSQYGKHIVYSTIIKLIISFYAMYLNLRISQWISRCLHDQVWNNTIKFELWIYKLGVIVLMHV